MPLAYIYFLLPVALAYDNRLLVNFTPKHINYLYSVFVGCKVFIFYLYLRIGRVRHQAYSRLNSRPGIV